MLSTTPWELVISPILFNHKGGILCLREDLTVCWLLCVSNMVREGRTDVLTRWWKLCVQVIRLEIVWGEKVLGGRSPRGDNVQGENVPGEKVLGEKKS